MVVRRRIKVGLLFSFCASTMALWMPSKSLGDSQAKRICAVGWT